MSESLLGLALVGSRARGFHHDVASKLQALMMALDEISEHAEDANDPTLRRAAEAATAATRELHAQLQAYRALARPAVPASVSLRVLVDAAAARVGATLSGVVPDVHITVPQAAATQALALCCETLGGPRGKRAVRITSLAAPLELTITGDGPSELPLPDVVAIVAHVFPAHLDGNAIVMSFGDALHDHHFTSR